MRTKDELDGLLSREDAIAPSAGFAISVMDAVRRAAEEPPPLRFPWGRLALGVVSCGVLAAAATNLLAGVHPGVLAAHLQGAAPAVRQLGLAFLGVAFSLALARLPRLIARS